MSEKTPCMKTRLERVALCADIASHYVQDMRVMPASGVARVAWDAMDHIDTLEAERNKLLHRATIAEECRDSDRQRAIDAEAKLAQAVGALTLIDALDPEAMSNGCSQSVLIGLVFRMGEIARATLAA